MSHEAELHFFADSARFGRALARALGAPARTVDVHRFPDGESLVRVRGEGAHHALLVRSLHDPNQKLVEVLLAADALRRRGAGRVTLVAPYLPYMRQDAVFRPGEALSQQVVGSWLGRAFDCVVTVEPHLHRVSELGAVVPCQALAVPAAGALAGWLGGRRARPLLVGPDEESEPWLRALAERTGLSAVVGRKQRFGDTRVKIALSPLLRGARRALIVDDIGSSGATLAETARALRAAGVARVEAVVVHALFARGALPLLRRAGIARVLSCVTVVHPSNACSVVSSVAEALNAAAAAAPRPRPALTVSP
jgi:ribose-phosphate pyrophosphokinase